jgi:hypothetical protein
MFTLLAGEARRIKKNLRIFVIVTTNVPSFAYRRSEYAPLRLKAQGSAADYTLRQYYWRYIARNT